MLLWIGYFHKKGFEYVSVCKQKEEEPRYYCLHGIIIVLEDKVLEWMGQLYPIAFFHCKY